MAIIQFYLGDRQFADLVDIAERLGMSSHQVAKHMVLLSTADDSAIMSSVRANNTKKGGQRVVKIIGG